MKRDELVQKIEFGIEEFILFAIIILNVLDAFEIIGSDLDYIKKIISWTALGYLVYKVSPSKLFVGFKRPNMDIMLIIAYFLMILKNIISYSYIAVESASPFLKPLYSFLIKYDASIEISGLYIGLFLIGVVSFNLSLRTPLKAPSILHLMRADKVKHDLKTFFIHFFSVIFIALGFFVVFFNLMMEWLAIAIDAPLLMIGLVSYFLIIIKHKDKFSPNSFLQKFGDFGADFYKGLMEHIRYKRAFLKVISGMLMLHIITDILTFLWKYFFGIGDSFYLNLLGNHPTLVELISADLSVSWMGAIIHITNFIGLLFLMISPIILWYSLYFNKKIKINNHAFALLAFGVFTLIMNPTFKIMALQNKLIYGVDILGVVASTYQIIPFSATLIIALCLSITLFFLHSNIMRIVLLIASKLFFISYVALYFYSISSYYIHSIPALASTNIVISIILTIFFIITTLFYTIGLGSFLVDTSEHLDEHLSS